MKKTTEKKIIRILRYLAGVLALVWMCAIFGFSAQNKEESGAMSESFSYRMVTSTGHFFRWNLDEDQLHEIADAIEGFVRKVAHMAEYAVLGILIFIWLGLWEMKLFRRCAAAIAASALYAASDEFHQLLVPGRAGRVTDVLIDSSGALLGVLLFVLFGKLIRMIRCKKALRQQTKE